MNDLVKRLRESAKPPLGWVIHTEAADRIERLEEALRWLLNCYITTLSGRPVRDTDEAIETARVALQDDKP